MASNRIGRINEEIRKELSALLRTVKDPRVAEAMLTITHVDTTPDLRQCKVYVSALNCKDEKDLMRGLKSAQAFCAGSWAAGWICATPRSCSSSPMTPLPTGRTFWTC